MSLSSLMTVKIPHHNKRCQELTYTYLFLHSESVIQNRNFKRRFPLKWEPFSAKNVPLQILIKQRTQTVSSKIIFPANEVSFPTEKLQTVGAGWQYKSSHTLLFHSRVASLTLTFQSVLPKITSWRGLREEKMTDNPTPNVEVMEF